MKAATRLAMSGLFSLAIVPIAGAALTFGDSGWTMLIGVGVMFLGTAAVIALHLARSKREFRDAEPELPSEKLSKSLVALSSAAILAVYGAGYLHTRTAADRFVAEAVEQRTAAVATSPLPETAGDAAASGSSDAAASGLGDASASTDAAGTAPRSSKAAGRAGAKQARTAAPNSRGTQGDKSAATGASSGYGLGETPTGADATSDTGLDSAGDSSRAAGEGDQGERQAAPGETAIAALPAAGSKVHYKDGTYQGWGTCRHGDIQATVVIDGGKIASADISKCYTRYPCDIISQLPGEVVNRQSLAVDYVSGATQSVYAFQEAVAAALAMAKGK